MRDERDAARLREQHAAQLHELSEQLAASTDLNVAAAADATAQHAARWLAATLGRPCAVYLRASPDPASPDPASPPSPAAPITPAQLQCCGAGMGAEAAPFDANAAAWALTTAPAGARLRRLAATAAVVRAL